MVLSQPELASLMKVEERIMPEVSLYGFCPRAGLGAGPSLLSQNDADSCGGVAERARGKQPKDSEELGTLSPDHVPGRA